MDKTTTPAWEFEDDKGIKGIKPENFEEGVKILNSSIRKEMIKNELRETRSAQFAMQFVTTISAK